MVTKRTDPAIYGEKKQSCPKCKAQQLTCLHTFVLLFITHQVNARSVVGLVDSRAEALVAATSTDVSGTRPVEGDVPVERHLCHGCLEALQRAGFLQAQIWPYISGGVTLE